MEVTDPLDSFMSRLQELIRLEPFLSTLFEGGVKPELHGLASTCSQLCNLVRPFAKELFLEDDAGVSIVKTTSLSDFINCRKISYRCTDADPHCLQAMNMTLSCAISQIPQLQAVELDLMSIANGSAPFSLVPALCTLACCTSLTNLSITSTTGEIEDMDILILGRLQGLTSLNLRFAMRKAGGADGGGTSPTQLPLSPLSQLTNLQQLVVKGVVPELPMEPGQHSLPSSLVSLRLEGDGGDTDLGERTLDLWMRQVPLVNNLQVLHLQNLCQSGGLLLEVDFGKVPHLRELRCLFAPLEGVYDCEVVFLSPSILLLADLEVLWVGTFGEGPWIQHCWESDQEPELTMCCSKLREMGRFSSCDLQMQCPSQLTLLHFYASQQHMPTWLTPTGCPHLQRLVVEAADIRDDMVQQLAALTQLTCLRLDVGDEETPESEWASLDLLGRSLPHLVRLELVSWGGGSEDGGPVLVVPDLSAFTQIKQLELMCVMDPQKRLPRQPRSTELFQGVSKLTQLEELKLEGYSTVTPGLVGCLVGVLQQLQVLEVGLCKHPDLLEELVSGGWAMRTIPWNVSHQSFADLEQLYAFCKPGLKLELGYAQQWRGKGRAGYIM